jgi:hypothetical protein
MLHDRKGLVLPVTPQIALDARKRLLDGIQIGGVGRKKNELAV